MSGWIKLHRSITDHWIYRDPKKFCWWIDMLFEVNYSDSKTSIGNSIYEVKRGQSALSIRSWANRFKSGTKAVINFFDLLEKDGMIQKKVIGKGKQSTTIVTIVNYDKYQSIEETPKQHKGNVKGIQYKKEIKKEKSIDESVYRSFDHLSITKEECNKLATLGYTKIQIDEKINALQNRKDNNKYKTIYLTIWAWLKKDYPLVENPEQPKKKHVVPHWNESLPANLGDGTRP